MTRDDLDYWDDQELLEMTRGDQDDQGRQGMTRITGMTTDDWDDSG